MTLETDDLRAAVSAGLINETQAASLTKLADERRGYRVATAEIDEPFELFKGFNEIFIVVGLIILYSGWTAITGIAAFSGSEDNSISFLIFGTLQVAVVSFMTIYFTLKRRMIAPSILLSIFLGLGAIQIGFAILQITSSPDTITLSVVGGTAAICLIAYWYVFRIPFSLMLSGLAVFAFAIGLFTTDTTQIKDLSDLFLLSTSPSISLITIGLGMGAFIIALRFDMSDPHRVTRRSANAFWLHVLAAPAIVNSIALTLYSNATLISFSLLAAFLIFIALVAVVIDRRSFLMSGIGYMIALVFTVLDGGYGLVILLIGLGLVLLGSNWEKLRCKLMNSLPDFGGKNKLPPWKATTKDTTND